MNDMVDHPIALLLGLAKIPKLQLVSAKVAVPFGLLENLLLAFAVHLQFLQLISRERSVRAR